MTCRLFFLKNITWAVGQRHQNAATAESDVNTSGKRVPSIMDKAREVDSQGHQNWETRESVVGAASKPVPSMDGTLRETYPPGHQNASTQEPAVNAVSETVVSVVDKLREPFAPGHQNTATKESTVNASSETVVSVVDTLREPLATGHQNAATQESAVNGVRKPVARVVEKELEPFALAQNVATQESPVNAVNKVVSRLDDAVHERFATLESVVKAPVSSIMGSVAVSAKDLALCVIPDSGLFGKFPPTEAIIKTIETNNGKRCRSPTDTVDEVEKRLKMKASVVEKVEQYSQSQYSSSQIPTSPSSPVHYDFEKYAEELNAKHDEDQMDLLSEDSSVEDNYEDLGILQMPFVTLGQEPIVNPSTMDTETFLRSYKHSNDLTAYMALKWALPSISNRNALAQLLFEREGKVMGLATKIAAERRLGRILQHHFERVRVIATECGFHQTALADLERLRPKKKRE